MFEHRGTLQLNCEQFNVLDYRGTLQLGIIVLYCTSIFKHVKLFKIL